MAHQFSPSSGFGTGYPVPPFYPPFVQTPQQLSNVSQSYQQPNLPHNGMHASTPRSNNMRYDTNAHISSQSSPLPFPPSLNPEIFKHFPPPPPPPPSGFPAGPGTPTNFQQFSHAIGNASQAYGQHNFPPFPQPQTPINDSFSQNQGITMSIPPPNTHFAHGFNHIENKIIQDFRYGTPTDARNLAPGLSIHNPQNNQSSHMNDGASHALPGLRSNANNTSTYERPTEVSNNVLKETTPASSQQNEGASPLIEQRLPAYSVQVESEETKSYPSLRDSAKAAILSLLPHKIMYNDLLAEGVDARVLQKLYTELGLNWKLTNARAEKPTANEHSESGKGSDIPAEQAAATPLNGSLQPLTNKMSGNVSAKLLQGGPSVVRSTTVASAGLERKDRIAQLLAAKTGKIGTGVNVSHSGSPAMVTESNVTQPPLSHRSTPADLSPVISTTDSGKRIKTIPQTELVRQKMEHLRKEAAEKLKAAVAATAATAPVTILAQPSAIRTGDIAQSQFAHLSTPARESLAREGFSSMIPGLFMTSADEDALNEDAVMSSSNQAEVLQSPASHQGQRDDQPQSRSATSSGLKRVATEDPVEESFRSAKRVASPRAESVGIEMEIDDPGEDVVSEGEIVDKEVAGESAEQGEVVDDVTLQETRQSNSGLLEQAYSSSTQQSEAGRSFNQDPQSNISPRTAQNSQQSETSAVASMEQRRGKQMSQSRTDSSVNLSPITAIATHLPQKTAMQLSSSTQGNGKFTANDRSLISPKPLAKLTPNEFAERAAQLKADFMRQRAMRQKQLVEGMPALNDEVVKTQERLEQHKSKLSDIRLEIKEHQASIIRACEAEDQVLKEIAHLEKQLQDGVSGQREFSKELREIKQQQENDSSSSSKDPTGSQSTQTRPSSSLNTSTQLIGRASSPVVVQASGSDGQEQSEQSIRNLMQRPLQQDDTVNIDILNNGSVSTQPRSETYGSSSGERLTPVEEQSDHSLATNGVNGTENMAYRQGQRKMHQTSADASDNAAYQEGESEDDDEPMDQSEDESEGTHMSVDQDSNGSASMSDSGSDDYEPPEPKPRSSSAPHIAELDDYEPSDDFQAPAYVKPHDAVDDYEPSEVVVAVEPIRQSPTAAPVSASTSTTNEFQHHQDGSLNKVSEVVRASNIDDAEKGLQLPQANDLIKPQETAHLVDPDVQLLSGPEPSSFPRFVPYQSPLSSFKSYRFHPTFAEQIKNGYRSLTYSNKIDPKRPICPTELTGEVCTDPECEEQHFGSMALTDDKILVQMSSANDIKDKALRDQYLLGLKQVIARLRQEGVKEFPLVADALSKYRREWTASQTGL